MDFILDASFALHWFFDDEITDSCDSVLTQLQELTSAAFVPAIWAYEMLNAMGKGVMRKRIERQKALKVWRDMQPLPIQTIRVPTDDKLLELALQSDIAVYDASYLSLAIARDLPLATGDGKLQAAAKKFGLKIIEP
jgi:predicted nucleic acid-binding protein